MNKSGLISVIIPVYKVENFIRKCVNSVISQTYSNIEIILVDDGSPDNCGKICDEYAKNDKRIKVIHKKNGGLSSARNAGLSIATGEFVMFVDSDDWISINTAEKMMKIMSEYNPDMIVFEYMSVFPDGRIERKTPIAENFQILNTKDAVELLIKDDQITNHVWRKFYKRKSLKENLFPVGKNYEDLFVSAELLLECDKIAYTNEAYYYYYQNNFGIVKTVNYKNCLDYYEGCNYEHSKIREKFPELEINTYVAKFNSNKIVENNLKNIKEKNQDVRVLLDKVLKENRELPKEIEKYLSKGYRIDYNILKF